MVWSMFLDHLAEEIGGIEVSGGSWETKLRSYSLIQVRDEMTLKMDRRGQRWGLLWGKNYWTCCQVKETDDSGMTTQISGFDNWVSSDAIDRGKEDWL